MDLIRGPVAVVSSAIQAELSRMLNGETLEVREQSFLTLDHAFGVADYFANIPTIFLVLPTVTDWSVLWNNSFLCDGYDSLCYCLTAYHKFETLHWFTNDATSTFGPGAKFCHRVWVANTLKERSVYCARDGRKWIFHQKGDPLPQEDLTTYSAPIKRNRLNEAQIAGLLNRLGANPWSDEFYDLSQQKCFTLRRLNVPPTVSKRSKDLLVRST